MFGDECHKELCHDPKISESQEDLESTEDFAGFQQLCQVRAKHHHLSFFSPSNETHVTLVSSEEN